MKQCVVLLALPLCHSSNKPRPRCLLRLMAIMPWALRWLSLRVEPPTICIMLVSVMVYACTFRFPCGCHVYHWDSSYHSPLEYTHGRHMCLLVLVHAPHWECTGWLLPPLLWVGGASCYWISCPAANPSISWGIKFRDCSRESPDPSAFLTWQERSSLPGFLPPYETVDSVIGIKPGDSSMVIRYQVDECTDPWLAEYFVAESHIYPGFIGKVQHYPLPIWTRVWGSLFPGLSGCRL